MGESKFKYYGNYVQEGARSFVDEHLDEALNEIAEGNTNMSEFIDDSRLHEWIDNDFIYHDLMDSALILEQSDNVETDSGLWEGQEPRDAIKTQAFFTFRTDMYLEIKDIFKDELDEKQAEFEKNIEKLEEEIEELKEAMEEKQNEIIEKDVEDEDYNEFEVDILEFVKQSTTKQEEIEEQVEKLQEQVDNLDDAKSNM